MQFIVQEQRNQQLYTIIENIFPPKMEYIVHALSEPYGH